MKKQYLYLTALIFICLFGCEKKKDRVFDESSTSRLNASVNTTYSSLNGKSWIFSFYPGANREYGGFNLFPTFTNSTDVTLQGDYTASTLVSTYRVYAGAGPILTFDTYNPVIHYFALPGYYTGNSTSLGIGATDSGMKGDFEFLVVTASKDSLTLKGRKYGSLMKMRSVDASKLTATIANYQAAGTKFNTYKGFSIEVAGKTLATNTTFSTVNGTLRTNRYLVVSSANVNLSFIVTDTGLEFYEDYTIEGVKFNKLNYVDATAQYPQGYFTNTSNTIKLVPRLTV